MVIVDSTGQIVLVNTQTEKLFGYTRDELLNQSVEMLLPERFRRSPSKTSGRVYESTARACHGAGLELTVCAKTARNFLWKYR